MGWVDVTLNRDTIASNGKDMGTMHQFKMKCIQSVLGNEGKKLLQMVQGTNQMNVV